MAVPSASGTILCTISIYTLATKFFFNGSHHIQEKGFNSRTREGCDVTLMPYLSHMAKFQFTHPRRVRHLCSSIALSPLKFQFTHPRRVRQRMGLSSCSASEFQFTHPRRVRQGGHYIVWFGTGWFQFTHPRRVRLPHGLRCKYSMIVSIHAPAKGATTVRACTLVIWTVVSIHAPAKGATSRHLYSLCVRLFQFTHPRRVRH